MRPARRLASGRAMAFRRGRATRARGHGCYGSDARIAHGRSRATRAVGTSICASNGSSEPSIIDGAQQRDDQSRPALLRLRRWITTNRAMRTPGPIVPMASTPSINSDWLDRIRFGVRHEDYSSTTRETQAIAGERSLRRGAAAPRAFGDASVPCAYPAGVLGLVPAGGRRVFICSRAAPTFNGRAAFEDTVQTASKPLARTAATGRHGMATSPIPRPATMAWVSTLRINGPGPVTVVAHFGGKQSSTAMSVCAWCERRTSGTGLLTFSGAQS